MRHPLRLTGSSFMLVFCAALLLSAQEPDVRLAVSPVEGEPGEVVDLAFRAAHLGEPVDFFTILFDLPQGGADYIASDIGGTASAHAPPRNVIFDPEAVLRISEGVVLGPAYLTGVSLVYGEAMEPIQPGEDLVLVRARLRVHAQATPGAYPLRILAGAFSDRGRSLSLGIEGDGVLEVKPATRPLPPDDLHCTQEQESAVLSWSRDGMTEGFNIRRNGQSIATLPGSQLTYRDQPQPGVLSYSVVAVAGGEESFPASCELHLRAPQPAPVRDLRCTRSDEEVSVSWENDELYDAIFVLRNGRLVAELPGDSRSYQDAASDLFTVYSVRGHRGGVESPSSSCRLNEYRTGGSNGVWVEEVRASAGSRNVPLYLFATNREPISAMQMSLRTDPSKASIRGLSLQGSVVADLGYDFFGFAFGPRGPDDLLREGELRAAVIFDFVPPFDGFLPPGIDQHVMTVYVDVPAEAAEGSMVPVEFFTRQSSDVGTPARTIFTDTWGDSNEVETRDGAVLIGASPIPAVEDAMAGEAPEEGGLAGAGGGAAPSDITVQWRNPIDYDAIRVERDGEVVAELPGERTSYRDVRPGPGIHRYRLIGERGDRESFPVTVTALPRGVPSTFLRGDADGDGSFVITDAFRVLNYLFRNGAPPPCLDAADADDNGRIELTDAVVFLRYLFMGAAPLPRPGPDAPWFDPTADELSCDG